MRQRSHTNYIVEKVGATQERMSHQVMHSLADLKSELARNNFTESMQNTKN